MLRERMEMVWERMEMVWEGVMLGFPENGSAAWAQRSRRPPWRGL